MRRVIRKAVCAALLSMLSTGAMAEWVKVAGTETDSLYIDTETIRWTEDSTKMWALSDFKEPQRPNERAPFKSEKAEYEYDCKGEKTRLLYVTSHTGNMAQGEIVGFNFAPGDWMPVAPETGLGNLWKIACRRT